MSEEISVVAIVEAKPGHERDVAAAVHACIEPSRKDAGCLLYTAHNDVAAPARFVFIERWSSPAALAAHEKTPHFQALSKAFATLLKSPLQAFVLRALA